MAAAVEGMIAITYRPLATMDELHVLLLASISVQASGVPLLEKVFSLPGNVVVRELAVLEAYGLAERSADWWVATTRGQRLTAVWRSFQNQGKAEVRAHGRDWLLGPGEFAVEEMTRDMEEIEYLARQYGIANGRAAEKFLHERRQTAEAFEAYVREWSSRALGDPKRGVFTELPIFDGIKLAETDKALTRIEELVAASIGQVVDRLGTTEHADGCGCGDGRPKDGEAEIRKHSQDVKKKFEEARRAQRRQNQQLAKIRTTCEALLAGQWLAAKGGPLVAAFNAEPAAFIFTSTVPLAQPEAPKRQASKHILTPPPSPKRKPEDEGIVRSLFRWLFG